MATATTTKTPELASEPATEEEARPRPYLISVDLYDRMVELGVFGDKSPVYLWEGQLVEPMTKGPQHEMSLTVLLQKLIRFAPEEWHVHSGGPTRLDDHSEPEPDLTVVRGSPRDYKTRHPTANDVALTVEVADSSRKFDEGEKRERYAAAAIPVYWVVNLRERCINVYTQPEATAEGPRYAGHQCFGPDDEVPVILDGREVGRIPVREVLP